MRDLKMSRYTYICENVECNYKHGFSMNFKPDESPDKVCTVCKNPLKVADYATATSGGLTPSLVSGVGDVNSRLSGDFRDLMQSIKKGSPGSNMKDYK